MAVELLLGEIDGVREAPEDLEVVRRRIGDPNGVVEVLGEVVADC